MSYNLKSIEFVLENCECVQIDKEYIDQLCIGKINSSYFWQNHLNSIEPNYFTDYCLIKFTKNFFLKSVYYPYEEHRKDSERAAYYRLLKGRDVTSVNLHFDNGENQQIYIPWKGNGFINKSQRVKTKNLVSIEWENKNFLKEIFLFFSRFYYSKIFSPLSRWNSNLRTKRYLKKNHII
jgi:hypothetical protein